MCADAWEFLFLCVFMPHMPAVFKINFSCKCLLACHIGGRWPLPYRWPHRCKHLRARAHSDFTRWSYPWATRCAVVEGYRVVPTHIHPLALDVVPTALCWAVCVGTARMYIKLVLRRPRKDRRMCLAHQKYALSGCVSPQCKRNVVSLGTYKDSHQTTACLPIG